MLPLDLLLLIQLAQVAPAAPAGGPSPADLAEIQKALEADAAAGSTTQPRRAVEEPAAAAPAPTGASILNPDLAFIADFALAAFSSDEPLQTGGHDPTRNGFNLQQLELSVSKAVDPYFRFDGNIVFSQFGVEIEEAYGTTLALPYSLQARAGQFLTRVGRLNATHPHAWDFVDQPFALGRIFGGEGNRGLGLELSWLVPVGWYAELVLSQSDAAGAATARSFFGAEDLGVNGPFDLQTTLALKQFFPLGEDLSLAWGVSGVSGPNASGHDNRTEVMATDLYLKYRPTSFGSYTIVALTSEWFYRRRQVPDDVLADVDGYTSLLWRFAQRWAVALRHEYGSAAHDRGGGVAEDPLDPAWSEGRQRWTANLTFWPTEFSRLRLQQSLDLPGWRDDPIWATFLALELVVGAHGSHKF